MRGGHLDLAEPTLLGVWETVPPQLFGLDAGVVGVGLPRLPGEREAIGDEGSGTGSAADVGSGTRRTTQHVGSDVKGPVPQGDAVDVVGR